MTSGPIRGVLTAFAKSAQLGIVAAIRPSSDEIQPLARASAGHRARTPVPDFHGPLL
jgi:hypothetical protein